jgi:hypothetical protein
VRGLLCQAPQHEVTVPHLPDRRFGDNRKGEAKRRGVVAIGEGPDLMQSPTLQLMQGKLPPPKKGRAKVGVHSRLGGKTSTRRWPLAIASLPLAGGSRDLGRGRKGAGGAGRGRARCGGIGQRHGNLLERADLRAQMLNQDPTPCPACLFNASRRNEDTCCTAWNVVTHMLLTSTFVPVLFLERVGAGVKVVRTGLVRDRPTAIEYGLIAAGIAVAIITLSTQSARICRAYSADLRQAHCGGHLSTTETGPAPRQAGLDPVHHLLEATATH